MSTFIFKNIKGETFTVNGPPDMTQEQANEIFQKQSDSGSLEGLKPGGILSAATQFAGGLTSAAAPFLQNAAGIASKLNGIVPSGTAQTLSKLSSTTVNAASAIGTTAKAASTIGERISKTPVTNPLTVGEYAKSTPATSATVGNLTPAQLTSTMAAAEKQSGQSATAVTDNGVGKYALDTSQLERAGYVKAGTTAKYLSQDQNSQTSVLSSSSVWTGKDGVKNVNDLAANSQLQSNIQQNLMTTGTQQAAQVGINVKNMAVATAGGFALAAAKTVDGAIALAKNQAATLEKTASNALDSLIKSGSYAVNLASQSLNDATKRVKSALPAVGTVDAAPVNAASKRIVGNSKIPSTIPEEVNAAERAANTFANYVDSFIATITSIRDKAQALYDSGNVSQDQVDALQADWVSSKDSFKNRYAASVNLVTDQIDKSSNPGKAQKILDAAREKVRNLTELNSEINTLLAKLMSSVS